MRAARLLLLAVFLAVPTALLAQSAGDSPWQAALNARIFAQYMRSGTLRGAHGFGSSNWFMGSVARTMEKRSLSANLMLSAEPLTIGECGYPRLLTPSFLCFERVLEDRQHTHPLIMEVSASIEQSLGPVRARLMAGLAGEPAFGPTAYFHRNSAAYDPIAPLGHDRFSPAHASYGLVTAGASIGRTSWEASVFNGSGHDDDPYDLDLAPMHSYAGRAGIGLGSGTRLQVSVATLQAAGGVGGHHGSASARMKLISATLERGDAMNMDGLAYTVGWSAQRMSGQNEHSGLLEAQWTHGAHALYTRAELLNRIEYEVFFNDLPDGTHEHIEVPRSFSIGELTAGYAVRLPVWQRIEASLGGRASMNTIPSYIRPRYDAKRGFAFAFFTSLRSRHPHTH
jgi:hypothetical protein